MHIQIVVVDEVNVKFIGLNPFQIQQVQQQTARRVAGANHTAAFRLGAWDGKESQFKDDGSTFLFMLPEIIPILESMGCSFELIDNRKPLGYEPKPISEDWLSQYVGFALRDHQVEAVNKAMQHRTGVISVATSGGKTLICASLVKAYCPVYRTITIVPSESLVNQTVADYEKCEIEVGRIYGKVPKGPRRDKEWKKRHIVATWQTLANEREHLSEFDVVLFDECHNCGDVMFSILEHELANAQVRLGLTGTFPRDKHKREKIMCRLGGDIIISVKPKALMDVGHIAQIDITMHPISHFITLPDGEWETEKAYLDTNKKRLEAIRIFCESLRGKNTLILTHPECGKQLAELLGADFIDQATPNETREAYYRKFDSDDAYVLVASYGTVGTGISINNIFQLIMLDVGKNETRIIQGIGRACRLDDYGLHSARVYDLYSTTNYSQRHSKERQKLYREYQYRYSMGEEIKPL